MRQALSDLRVVEVGSNVAASWCGKAFAPALRQHNACVCKGVLGLDDVEHQRLVTEQIAVDDYLDPQGDPY